MKAVFSIYCTDDYRDFMGLNKLINSLNYFHPDVPVIIFDDEKIKKAKQKYPFLKKNKPQSPNQGLYPLSCLENTEEFDLVIHIDADSTITGDLNGIMFGDFDIAVVRNNHFGKGAGNGKIITIEGVPWDKFCNAGLVAFTNKQAINDWFINCKNGIESGNWDDENNELNRLCFIQNSKYKIKVLDDIETKVSYGLTNVFGKQTHWDSWKDLYIKNEELYQINPLGNEVKIKVLHLAGGAKLKSLNNSSMRQWLNSWVSPEIKIFLEKITK